MTTAPPSPDSSAPAPTKTSGASAGRGGLALTGGKLFFLVSGLVQQIVLKAVLGLSGYGALSTTLSIASIAYNPMVQSGIQGISRETAGLDDEQRPSVLRRLLRIHLSGSLILAGVFWALAPLLASALGAPHITNGVRALAGVLFLYGLYAPLVGYLNGQKRFLAQASLDAMAAALRTVGLLGGAYLSMRLDPSGGSSVLGTCLGFCSAATLILLIASRLTGWGSPGETTKDLAQRYFRMLRHVWAGQILLNLLFQADALLLRRFAADAAQAAGLAGDAADPYVGAYRAAQLFCFLPFQLLTSVTFVLFPLLAQARARGENEEVAHLVQRGLRLCVLITGMLVCVLVARPQGLLELVFGHETAELGAPAMRILALGMGAFAVLGVMTSALNSLGLERISLGLFLGATTLVGLGCTALAHGQALDQTLLERTALATSLAMFIVTFVAAIVAKTTVGGTLGLFTTLRTGVAVATSSTVVARFIPEGVLMTLIAAPLSCLIYLSVQTLTRELKKDDGLFVLALFRRG